MEKTGDKYNEYSYQRISKLNISSPVSNLKSLVPGDCLIAFSRKKCHALKNHIEKQQPGSCAIIYGNLPPDVRKDQAFRFNTQQQKYLIATDAIGMGLNYNIKRFVFMETSKNDGKKKRKLFPHEIKQIAGRAGRFENIGLVTTSNIRDLADISIGLNYHYEPSINKAGLFPAYQQLKEFADNHPQFSDDFSYVKLLTMFSKAVQLENIYFLQSIEEICSTAKCLQSIGLSLEAMHKFCNNPIRLNNYEYVEVLKNIAKSYKAEKEIKFR